MISEDDVQKAVDWLVESAAKAAQARANREYLDEYRRVLRASLMREAQEGGATSIAAQEAQAMADPRYLAHLEALRTAIADDERFRWLRVAAETKVSCWQSQVRLQRP